MSNELPISWQQLIDWLDGRLTPAEAQSIAAQVTNGSEGSAADLAWLRSFLHVAEVVSLDEPPSELRTTLRASFADYKTTKLNTEHNQGGLFERLVAALSFDSGLQLGLAGARGSAPARQLVYSTDAADIALTIQPEADGLRIDGLILPIMDVAVEAFRVQVSKEDEIIADEAVDELGEFAFANLLPDLYQLTLTTESLTIVIESVDLQEKI